MDISAARLRINDPNAGDSESKIVVDFFLEVARTIVRRKHLYSDRWRPADNALGRLRAKHDRDIWNSEASFLHLNPDFHTSPNLFLVVRSQVMRYCSLHIAV